MPRRGIAPGAPGGLHQQREQALGGTKVAAEERGIGIDRRDQADAPEVVALGHHLRADEDVDLARVDRAELRFERALLARAVGVDAGDARFRQQRRELLLEPLGAAPDRRDVEVAALGTGARHRLGQAAMVAAQSPVLLVEDAPGAAVRAAAEPAAFAALQHRRIAAPVQEHQALLAAGDPLAQCRHDLRREPRDGSGAEAARSPRGKRPMSTRRIAGQAAPPTRSGKAMRR